MRYASSSLLCIVALGANATAGGVRIFDAAGSLPYPSIQAAVDASVDGDVLLVGAGTYATLTVQGKTATRKRARLLRPA